MEAPDPEAADRVCMGAGEGVCVCEYFLIQSEEKKINPYDCFLVFHFVTTSYN